MVPADPRSPEAFAGLSVDEVVQRGPFRDRVEVVMAIRAGQLRTIGGGTPYRVTRASLADFIEQKESEQWV